MPHRNRLKETMDDYFSYLSRENPIGAEEEIPVYHRFLDFVRREPRCFERSTREGHVTGSALVVTHDLTRVLLTHHRKLNLWLQLGGHADGDSDIAQVALKEANEESGLTDLIFFPPGRHFPRIWDLDIHWIPPHKTDPGHYHFDVRYLMTTKSPDAIVTTEESHELRWFLIEHAYAITTEKSMHRMFDKIKFFQ